MKGISSMLSGFLQLPFLLLIKVYVFPAAKAVEFICIIVHICDHWMPNEKKGKVWSQDCFLEGLDPALAQKESHPSWVNALAIDIL